MFDKAQSIVYNEPELKESSKTSTTTTNNIFSQRPLWKRRGLWLFHISPCTISRLGEGRK